MLVTCISDTHELHRELELPPGDLLIHAGDITFFSGRQSIIRDFNEWLGEQPYRYKVVIPGNHDTLLADPVFQQQLTNAHLLINAGVELEGIKIWGSPVTALGPGAFGIPDDIERAAIWSQIPLEIHILVTHVPPYGILDQELHTGQHSGCRQLLSRVVLVRPQVHVFGHVHHSAGQIHSGVTHSINAALAGELGDLDRNPIRIEVRSG